MRGNIDSYLKYHDISFNRSEHVLQVSHGNNMTCYVGTEDLARHAEEGKNLLDRDFAKDYILRARKQCAADQEFFGRLKAIVWAEQTNEQLLDLWQQLMDHYALSVAYFRSTQEEPSRALVNAVARTVSAHELKTPLLSPSPY